MFLRVGLSFFNPRAHVCLLFFFYIMLSKSIFFVRIISSAKRATHVSYTHLDVYKRQGYVYIVYNKNNIFFIIYYVGLFDNVHRFFLFLIINYLFILLLNEILLVNMRCLIFRVFNLIRSLNVMWASKPI